MEVKKGGLEEDHQSSSLKEKIVNRKKPIHLFILNGIDAFFVFGFVKVFGILAYARISFRKAIRAFLVTRMALGLQRND